MGRTSVDDQPSRESMLGQDRRDVLFDSLKNIVVTRLTAYVLVFEVVFFGTGFIIDATTGAYSPATEVPLIMAGIFGVLAVIVGSIYLLSVLIRAVIAIFRTYILDHGG